MRCSGTVLKILYLSSRPVCVSAGHLWRNRGMRIVVVAVTGVLLLAAGVAYFSGAGREGLSSGAKPQKGSVVTNPVTYFEIPVTDLERAMKFYRAVFGVDFTRETVDGNEMAFFPFSEAAPGATGALAKGPTYKPSKDGSLVYFRASDIDAVLARAAAQGGKTLYPKTAIGAQGFVAEFEDSEGNRVALHSPLK